jgi:geranylgeranyl diphosphate synthase type II
MTEQLHLDFQAFLKDRRFTDAPQSLYEPVNYILEIGGKRLRPILLLKGCQLFSEQYQSALPAALAIEVFHNFTLLHDDIMDEAPLRRGQPTVHEAFGLSAGILSGDVMLIHAYELIMELDLPAADKLQILQLFNRTAVEVCRGQQMDMDFETREDVELSEYLQMIEYKTAVLIAAALEIGGRIGGASSDDAGHLYEFGRNMGLAFQVQDDILDTFGDPEKFGKRPGGDIIQNKKTFLILRALELAGDSQRKQLQDLYFHHQGDNASKVATVTALFKELGVPEMAAAAQRQYRQSALAHLDAVGADEAKKAALATFAQSLVDREV